MAVQRGGGGGGGTKHITNKQRCARKNINTTKAIQRNTYKKDNSTNNNINKRRNKTKKEDALNRLRGNALATEEKEATLPCPGLSADAGKELLEDMLLGRQFEDMCAQMYYRGKMFGFVHLYSGQEAVSTGVIKAGRSGSCTSTRVKRQCQRASSRRA